MIRCVISGVSHHMRSGMFHAMLNAPYERYVSGEINSYTGRINSDVDRVEHLIMDFMRFVIRPVAMVLVMAIIMIYADPWMTLLLFIVTPLCIISARTLQRGLRHYEEVSLNKRQQLQHDVAETLDNVRIVRSFNKEAEFQARVTTTIDEYSSASISLAIRRQIMHNIISTLQLLPWICIVAYGAWRVQIGVDHGGISFGDFMMFVTFEGLMRSPIGQFAHFCAKFNADLVAPERIKEVCDLPQEPSGQAQADTCDGDIHFNDIHFSYNADSEVISGLNLHIAAGERVAIVGSSGAGKSTIVNLLLGFYPINHGHIELDGTAIEDLNRHWYRKQLGIVMQDNPMFDGTIRSNLCLDNNSFDEETLWQALKSAQADDFVHSLPQTLDTHIGNKGLKLSGGQRQRLAIARVILYNPSCVLLDEATSSLDSVTESQIQKAMDALLEHRSSITIAHRLSTIVASDRICYLEKGKIVEEGSHGELIKKKGLYFKLYQTQVDGLL
ncbi:MAG: ABC transporter ATP-binding protein [Planctomycetes bacterium]|nr:ABC transporter ATP-binding protein [Planctomycetota bacterium]